MHAIRILKVWRIPAADENSKLQIHIKCLIDNERIGWDNYDEDKVPNKQALLVLVEENADKMLERVPKTLEPELREDLFNWDVDTEELDFKMLKGILKLLVEEINILRKKGGLAERTEEQIRKAVKQILKG